MQADDEHNIMAKYQQHHKTKPQSSTSTSKRATCANKPTLTATSSLL